jgi:PIN domain nuclease of toxin-antitoxin system
VNLLLDTHALLWWLADDPSLGERARRAIADGKSTVFLSAVVVWEIRIKQSLGKLEAPDQLRQVLERQRFVPLPLTVEHAHAIADLPPIHRDPFDRLLVAQALTERLTVVTRNRHIPRYGVSVLDA